MHEPRRSGTKRSLHWVLTALAIGALGCPDTSPPKTGLEPSSSLPAPAPPTDEQRYAGTYVYAGSEAEKAGMKMPPTKLLIFGNPAAGTPLMLAAPSIAIDLPLKILVWEDAHKNTWVSYNSSAYVQERHNLPTELLQNIAVVESLAAKAAE